MPKIKLTDEQVALLVAHLNIDTSGSKTPRAALNKMGGTSKTVHIALEKRDPGDAQAYWCDLPALELCRAGCYNVYVIVDGKVRDCTYAHYTRKLPKGTVVFRNATLV